MKTIRRFMTIANLTLVLTLGAMGMYYFGPLGILMHNQLGIALEDCPDPYFADAQIPTWDPSDYIRKQGEKTRKRTLAEDYPYICKERITPPPPPPPPPITRPKVDIDKLLAEKVRSIHSVVYSSLEPERSGCYLRTLLKSGAEGMYFYSPGDKFHVQYDTRKGKRLKIFTLKEIVEVVPGRIYEILFETDEGERVIRQYERKFPREFDLAQNINR